MPVLKPPFEHRKALLTLAQLGSSNYETLKAAVSTREAPEFEEPKRAEGEERNEGGEKPAFEILDTLFTMHSVRLQYGLTTPEFVQSVMEGLSLSEDPMFSPSETETAAKRLEELLSIEGPLSLGSKVSSVVREHEKVFCSCRVMTDIRPVFGEDPESEPLEMAILHTIKIGYHLGSKHTEIFIAADASDLRALKEAIERAEAKEETLTDVLQERGFDVSDLS